ncbi:MAG: mechanosensitive ion channel family protein [Rhodocyclales bacterium]|nr:mechanosensitive ion channel family protein [Rhodocyclales bacterium]
MTDLFNAANLREWFEATRTGLHILLILILAAVVQRVARRLIRLLREYLSRQQGSHEDVKRIETLSRVFRYIATVVVSVVAGLLVLGELGIAIAPILGAAGVVGIAVGFGAQSLIKDYFNGFFLLLENQVRQGDVVEAGGKGGLVEEVTLRYMRLRDYDGNVHFVPNGTVSTVTNRSRDYAQSVTDVGVAYQEDVDAVFEVMREVGRDMRADPEFGGRILEDLEIAGVESWGDSAVVLRCRFKVLPLEQWNTRREFLRRLKRAFDERGIEIPYPHLTVYAGQNKRGRTAPFRTLGVAGSGAPPAQPRIAPKGTPARSP